jgi:hypothetical protein
LGTVYPHWQQSVVGHALGGVKALGLQRLVNGGFRQVSGFAICGKGKVTHGWKRVRNVEKTGQGTKSGVPSSRPLVFAMVTGRSLLNMVIAYPKHIEICLG